MPNPEHLAILKEGVETWNAWREEHPDLELWNKWLKKQRKERPDWAEVWNLMQEDEPGRIVLDLMGADLEGANLSGANFSRTNLVDAKLGGSDLSGANLSGVRIEGADLYMANLSGANLERATFWETVFGRTDLSGAKGLDQCRHEGSSTMDIRTLRLSWPLPSGFLRGCGLSDWEIEAAKLYDPDLTPGQIAEIQDQMFQLRTGGVIQYHSCFISYSSKNSDFVRRLHADLQNTGVRCWFAPEDMKIGDEIRPTIDSAIQLRDKLLLILSDHAIGSQWVKDEVEAAYEEEARRGETVLFPIRLDDAVLDTSEAWASKLRRQRHIGDFCRWKDHDPYQTAFERLLRDLKAS